MTFIKKLSSAWISQNSLLCIGLDPNIDFFPYPWYGKRDAIYDFCKTIVDITADIVCAFKLQIAYFAAVRAEDQLEEICLHIKHYYPHVPIILDAKRGDVITTGIQYAKEAFERYDVDAVTVNPYFGYDSVAPYLEWKTRGVIVLCKTSNTSSYDIQCSAMINNIPLYQYIATLVAKKWNIYGQCSLVMGATFPKEIACVRNIIGNMPLLIPGIGIQEGNLKETIISGKTRHGSGMIISSSRKILYPKLETCDVFTEKVRCTALKMRDAINKFR